MPCRYCHPEQFSDCDGPITEGHYSVRWTEQFSFRDAEKFAAYLNGVEIKYPTEICPGPCGFIQAYEYVTDANGIDKIRVCECRADSFPQTMAEIFLVGRVEIRIFGRELPPPTYARVRLLRDPSDEDDDDDEFYGPRESRRVDVQTR